jgi:peptide/nickel transport system permease protein
LKNAAMVPVTVLGLQFAYTLGGTVVLERIFAFNGMGGYYFTALDLKDVPIIQGVTLLVAVTFVLVNLFVDVLYAYLNPRVRLG